MGRILRDIYADISIAPLLGFKGGTCAYFFYGLPRFSVDLDFDLLSSQAGAVEIVAGKIRAILAKYGLITDFSIKQKTILYELVYAKDERRLKVEISTLSPADNMKSYYEQREYLGIPMLIAKKDYMFSTKLIALTSRRKFTMRDVYDIWYFADKLWPISEEIIENWTGKKLRDYLPECIEMIEKIPRSQILTGIGELIDDKQKRWVRDNLQREVVAHLSSIQSTQKK